MKIHFKTLSKTDVIDHVRYRFYWESYVRDPVEFIKELEEVAKIADKYGIKVIYDNHQFHTSSWLNVGRGTGFPAYLLDDSGIIQARKWWDTEVYREPKHGGLTGGTGLSRV